MKEYKVSGKRGIDDLKSLYAFHGNSQGDTSVSNSIIDYNNSQGWMSFTFDCDLTQEAITNEIEKRKRYNENYIKRLNKEGKFGEEYYISINIKENLLFDAPLDVLLVPLTPTESFRMVFLNLNKEDGKN